MNAPSPTPPVKAKCVVWHAPKRPPRPELTGALNRPGFRTKRCENPWSAFAHLTARRGEWAARPGESMVLLLVDPPSLDRVTDVIEIVDRYNPGAAIWMFEAGGKPQLRSVTERDLSAWRADTRREPVPAVPPEPVAPTGKPMLRLSGDGDLARPRVAEPPTARRAPDPNPDVKAVRRPDPLSELPDAVSGPPQPLLSDEELAMLLSEDAEKKG